MELLTKINQKIAIGEKYILPWSARFELTLELVAYLIEMWPDAEIDIKYATIVTLENGHFTIYADDLLGENLDEILLLLVNFAGNPQSVTIKLRGLPNYQVPMQFLNKAWVYAIENGLIRSRFGRALSILCDGSGSDVSRCAWLSGMSICHV